VNRFLEPADVPAGAVVLDARPAAQFLAGHVPGARNLDLTTPKFSIRSAPDLEAFHAALERILGAAGLEAGRPVVVYDNGPETRASRAAWALEYAGLEVGLLRGGLPAWVAAGGALEAGPGGAVSPTAFRVSPRPAALATADDLLERSRQGEVLVIDARGDAEFRGEAAPPGTPRRGRVPGARQLEWTRLVDAGGIKPRAALERELAAVPRDRPVVVYCQSGARSAVLFHALESLGYEVSNYVGSAGEWLADPSLPVETGEGGAL
jgi:thiosulfate/3-mercaptopyruvate sulfurtransferase